MAKLGGGVLAWWESEWMDYLISNNDGGVES